MKISSFFFVFFFWLRFWFDFFFFTFGQEGLFKEKEIFSKKKKKEIRKSFALNNNNNNKENERTIFLSSNYFCLSFQMDQLFCHRQRYLLGFV